MNDNAFTKRGEREIQIFNYYNLLRFNYYNMSEFSLFKIA